MNHNNFLPIIPKYEWCPSQHIPLDTLGNRGWTTKFILTGRLSDGYIAWQGVFEDRDDADAFLWAMAKGQLKRQKALWRLCTPEWSSLLNPNLVYDFSTQIGLTASPGSLQSWTIPNDWNNSNNEIEVLSGGGGGGGNCGGGGGGGSYERILNQFLTGTPQYQIGIGGQGSSSSASTGQSGGQTWFNGATIGASSVATNGGSAGGVGKSGTGGNGGSDNKGTQFYKGGNGGPGGSGSVAGGGGGGGSAGPAGAGGNGGAGFQGGDGGGNGTRGAVGSGSWNGFAPGQGGLGGGGGFAHAGASGGPGSAYGGGGGGAGNSAASLNGNGAQGLIIITYTPLAKSGFNMPGMGL